MQLFKNTMSRIFELQLLLKLVVAHAGCFVSFSKCFVDVVKHYQKILQYTCQHFLRCRREIFILGVLGFLKTTRSFPKIPEDVRSLPKTSEVCRRRSYQENVYPQNQRSRGRYCHLFILHMVFVPYMGLS